MKKHVSSDDRSKKLNEDKRKITILATSVISY